MKFILLDVEGTTTSIDFVHKTLFPYAYENLEKYLLAHQNNSVVQKAISDVKATFLSEQGVSVDLSQVTTQLKTWIQDDRKHPALKELQGLIWKQGYESGIVLGHVYEDVLPAFKKWIDAGLQLGIYSSGSVLAQKLIFKYTTVGDLTPYLSFHFDTAVGAKREISSYTKICEQLKIAASEVLFLSDIAAELEAAQGAGLQTRHVVREKTVADKRFISAHTFADIKL